MQFNWPQFKSQMKIESHVCGGLVSYKRNLYSAIGRHPNPVILVVADNADFGLILSLQFLGMELSCISDIVNIGKSMI